MIVLHWKGQVATEAMIAILCDADMRWYWEKVRAMVHFKDEEK